MAERPAIYLDYNAGAPLGLRVSEALVAFLRDKSPLANPSSQHAPGRRARKQLADSIEKVARSLGPGVLPDHLVVTSSGSEANQTAIRSAFFTARDAGNTRPHWIVSAGEHDSVRRMATWWINEGGELTVLPLNPEGEPRLDLLDDICQPSTCLLSLIWINNETGVISDIERASLWSKKRKIFFHLDGAQAWGKIAFTSDAQLADFTAYSGHKIGAPGGIGILRISSSTPFRAHILGSQNAGRRGGTENLLGLIGLGLAAENIQSWPDSTLRDRFESLILRSIPGLRINGSGAQRVPNTCSLSVDGVRADSLIPALDLEGFAVSAGSACSSGSLEPSAVLLAMGRTPQEASQAIRVSYGPEIGWFELQSFASALERCVQRMRSIMGEENFHGRAAQARGT